MTQQLWSDQRIYLEFFSHLCVADQVVTGMRNEYEAELEKARTELAAANAVIAELTDKLRSEGYNVWAKPTTMTRC